MMAASEMPVVFLPRVILASASPRRRELLQLLGVEFEIRPSAIAEQQLPGESSGFFVAGVAGERAGAVAGKFLVIPPGRVVLGWDTEVILDGRALGKPQSDAHAVEMLRLLAGRAHDVVTGISLISTGRPP